MTRRDTSTVPHTSQTPSRFPVRAPYAPRNTSHMITDTQNTAYVVGDKVRHDVFRNGVITRISESLFGPQATINFDNYGEKTLTLSFADRNIRKLAP